MDDSAQKPNSIPPLPQIDSSTPPPPPPPITPTAPTMPSAPSTPPEPLPATHPMPRIDESLTNPVPTPVIASKKTWGTGALVGSVMALVLLVAGLGFGLWQVRQNQQVVQPQAAAAGCYSVDLANGCPITNNTCWRAKTNNACRRADGTVDNTAEVFSGSGNWDGNVCYTCDNTENTYPADRGVTKCSQGYDYQPGPSCGGSTPTPEPPQCTTAPKVLISVNDGPFSWRGNSFQVTAGQKICYKPEPFGNKYSARPIRQSDGGKGATSVNSTGCFTVNATDVWTTGQIEAYENECSGGPNGTCEQLYYRESCVNRTDLVLGTATPTPTPTPTPTYQCEMVKVQSITRAGVAIVDPTLDKIKLGDVVVFRATANGVGTTVSKIKFTLTKGGVSQTPSEVATTVVAGKYQADYSVTVNTATTYVVKGEPVSP